MRKKYKIAGLLAAAGIASGVLVNSLEEKTKSKVEGLYVLIPGTWSYDADTMRLPDVSSKSDSWFQDFFDSLTHFQGPRRIHQWQQNFDLKEKINPRKLDFGASQSECDIGLEHINQYERKLFPQNGAALVLLEDKDFLDTTYEDLTAAEYSCEGIDGDLLTSGTIIGIRTNKGNYAKLRIDGFLPLVHKANSERDIDNYHLEGTLHVYKNAQEE